MLAQAVEAVWTGPLKGSQKSSKRGAHLYSLDGLRGLAALWVVISHSVGAWVDIAHPIGALKHGLDRLPSGHLAVVLFFVLSGFVLFVAHAGGPQVGYGAYVLRRLFRLYPAALVALGVSLALHLAIAPVARPDFGAWVTANSVYPVEPVMVVRNILLLGVTEQDRALDPVLWSLSIELRFSAVFLALAFAATRTRLALPIICALAFIVAKFMFARLGLSAPYQIGGTQLGVVAVTLQYLPGFCFGILAAQTQLSGRKISRLGVALGSIGVLLVARHLHDDTLLGLGFAGLIYLAAAPGWLRTALSASPIKALGDISYSLYVIHFPVLVALIYIIPAHGSRLAPVLLAPLLSILLATLMFKYIEQPGIALGKRLAAHMRLRRTPLAQGV